MLFDENPRPTWRIGVMGMDAVPRQSQSWLNDKLSMLLEDFLIARAYEARIGPGIPTLGVIPCHTGMMAALWAGPRGIEYDLWLPWSVTHVDLPITLNPGDPFVHDQHGDGKAVMAGAKGDHLITSEKRYSLEAVIECRRRLSHESDVLIISHDSRNPKVQPMLIRAKQEKKVAVIADWRKKKAYIQSKELLPDVGPEPF